LSARSELEEPDEALLEDDELPLLELEDDDEELLDDELEDDMLEVELEDDVEDEELEEEMSGPVPPSSEQPGSIPTPAKATLPERIFRNSRRRSRSVCGIEVLSGMVLPRVDLSNLRACPESASCQTSSTPAARAKELHLLTRRCARAAQRPPS
jgi:hypothetical protein